MSELLAKRYSNNRFRRVVMGTLSILAISGFISGFNSDDSGEVTTNYPSRSFPTFVQADGRFNILSWNMHNQTSKRRSQLKNLISRYSLDALNLQEVSATDKKKVVKSFPDWYVTYSVADKRTKAFSGGYGNVIMTRQKPRDIRSRSFKGTELANTLGRTMKGVATDTALATTGDADFSETRKRAYEENRSALSLTVSEKIGNSTQDIRLINTHLGVLSDINSLQFDSLLEFVADNDPKDIPAVICGDLNREPEDVVPSLAKEQFITPVTNNTAENNTKTLDYCSYSTDGYLGMGEVWALGSPKTDHSPLIGSWALGDQSK